jgi:hypothetical protein
MACLRKGFFSRRFTQIERRADWRRFMQIERHADWRGWACWRKEFLHGLTRMDTDGLLAQGSFFLQIYVDCDA